MTYYKYKPEKHRFRESLESIDEIHDKQVTAFKNQQITVSEKKNKIKLLEQEIIDINNDIAKTADNVFEKLKKITLCKKTIANIQTTINKSENYNSEINYYSKTYDVLSDYYNITNGVLYNKELKQIEPQQTQHTVIQISNELLEITDSHKKRKLKRPVSKRNKKIEMNTPNIMNILNSNTKIEQKKICKADLQNKYLMIMDKEYACINSKDNIIKKCLTCNVDKVIIYNDALICCPKCGMSDIIFIETDAPSHDEIHIEKPKYPYKKIGHCIEKLNQFLCKGTANIPPHVISTLENEILKHSILKEDITLNFLENIMKKHKFGDYYENIMFIYNKLTGRPAQTISHTLHDSVIDYFKKADQIFETKYKPSDRNNFLKYTFVLHKIFLLHNRPDIAYYFKLLKSPDKLKQQERIWERICTDLGWTYHGS